MIHRARRWVMRFDLSDEDWALLEPLLPKSRKSARVDDRKIMNAIFYVLRTGMPLQTDRTGSRAAIAMAVQCTRRSRLAGDLCRDAAHAGGVAGADQQD